MARQRILATALAIVAVLGAACEARSSVEAAQTAIVAVQTAGPGAQALVTTMQGLLQGASVEVRTTPEGAQASDVTSVTIEATDSLGTLTQTDSRLRQVAATGALAAAAQYFPNATITLTVSGADGTALVSGSVAPGQSRSEERRVGKECR